jgi:hypothetical protein
MYGACRKLLAGSRFAVDQHWRIEAGDPVDERLNAAKYFRSTDHCPSRIARSPFVKWLLDVDRLAYRTESSHDNMTYCRLEEKPDFPYTAVGMSPDGVDPSCRRQLVEFAVHKERPDAAYRRDCGAWPVPLDVRPGCGAADDPGGASVRKQAVHFPLTTA